jgi:hypothetical protein
MTRRRTGIALLAAVTLVVVGTSCRRAEEPRSAAERAREHRVPPVPSEDGRRPAAESALVREVGIPIDGAIVSVEETSLVVRDDRDERHEFALDERTRFVGADGREVGRDALREGTLVRAHFSPRGDEMVAREVQVVPER